MFHTDSDQQQVYLAIGEPVLDCIFGGINGTVMAYGQTGGGKTWTMEGSKTDYELRGLIPRTMEGLFSRIRRIEGCEFTVKCAYVEIYNEKIMDLLDTTKTRLEIKEDKLRGVFIQGLTEVYVGSLE